AADRGRPVTAPTQRPASNSEGRKRKAEKAATCRCGCLSEVHVGEIGCACGLPDEPPCTPAEPDADEREGCPSCDRDLSAPGVSGHECYTYAERAARIASRESDAHLAAAKAEKVARGMERLRAVNPMNGDSSNY